MDLNSVVAGVSAVMAIIGAMFTGFAVTIGYIREIERRVSGLEAMLEATAQIFVTREEHSFALQRIAVLEASSTSPPDRRGRNTA